MQMVREGDLVKMTFANRSFMDHPMHLHGHHVLVLSRNGEPVSGSPWWADTLNVAPGETYEVAFRADNPGLWMDHCHNLAHGRPGHDDAPRLRGRHNAVRGRCRDRQQPGVKAVSRGISHQQESSKVEGWRLVQKARSLFGLVYTHEPGG